MMIIAEKNISPSPKKIWAYAYEIVPPQAKDRLRTIRTLLHHENSDAQREARTWAGRFVIEPQITHILVVSDSPDQDREVNHKLEVELKRLEAGFSITTSMAVVDDATAVVDDATAVVDDATAVLDDATAVVDDATPPLATEPPSGAGP